MCLSVIIVLLLLICIICMACKSPVVASCFGGLAVLLAILNLPRGGVIHVPAPPLAPMPMPVDPTPDPDLDTAYVKKNQPLLTANPNSAVGPNAPLNTTGVSTNVGVSQIPNNAYVGRCNPSYSDERRPVVLNYGVPVRRVADTYQHRPTRVPARALCENPTTALVVPMSTPTPTRALQAGSPLPGSTSCQSTNRDASIAAVVPDLVGDDQAAMKEVIRNQGLYGIRGNLSCEKLKRSAQQDTRFIEPVGARNAWAAYNAYDQPHSRDPFMIPSN